jgi:hypothetical protein
MLSQHAADAAAKRPICRGHELEEKCASFSSLKVLMFAWRLFYNFARASEKYKYAVFTDY